MMEPPTAATATGSTVEVRDADGRWHPVCVYERLEPGRGVAALLGTGSGEQTGEQVALYRDRTGDVHAVGNRDPFSGAYVMSRGILGSRHGRTVVVSPMYKQAFDVATGNCLDEEGAALPVFEVRLRAA